MDSRLRGNDELRNAICDCLSGRRKVRFGQSLNVRKDMFCLRFPPPAGLMARAEKAPEVSAAWEKRDEAYRWVVAGYVCAAGGNGARGQRGGDRHRAQGGRAVRPA